MLILRDGRNRDRTSYQGRGILAAAMAKINTAPQYGHLDSDCHPDSDLEIALTARTSQIENLRGCSQLWAV